MGDFDNMLSNKVIEITCYRSYFITDSRLIIADRDQKGRGGGIIIEGKN